MKNLYFSILAALAFFFVLLFPQESFSAASSGLLLWYETLVPTLLPVMILSHLLLSSGLALRLSRRICRPLTALLSISPGGVYALLAGFLCGCPMGAKVLSELRKNGQISQAEASYLAAFVNNVSPAFLTNFLVINHMQSTSLVMPTLVILLGAPLLYGLFSNHRYRVRARQMQKAAYAEAAHVEPAHNGAAHTETTRARQTQKAAYAEAAHVEPAHTGAAPKRVRDGVHSPADSGEKNKAPATAITFVMVDASITDSICSITKLGGYILLFAVFTAMIDALPLHSPFLTAVLAGITEISGGIHRLSQLALPFPAKYLLLIAASAFGGLCCMAQSAQMLACIGLPLRSYLAARASITVIAVLMALCYIL